MNAKKEMDFYGARLSVHDIVQMQNSMIIGTLLSGKTEPYTK